MSKKKHVKDKTEEAQVEDEENAEKTPNEKIPAETFDEYQCTGNVQIDFAKLCALLGIKDIPAVRAKQPGSSASGKERSRSQMNAVCFWSKPCLQVELETNDPLSAKSMWVSGWKVDEQIARVLQRMLPSLIHLQFVHFWQAGLTDRMVISLMNTISLCSNLRFVKLEGNPLPEQSYHCLLSENSNITHLSLQNNRIGDEGARLIGSALSTTRSSNKNLLLLNLAFNSIGDAGAAYIAQGLRLNQALLFLSLSNNQIGDSGAAHLATILGDFALTHEEVVERRKLLLERMQSVSSPDSEQTPPEQHPSIFSSSSHSISKGANKGASRKKETPKQEKRPGANKENPKSNKKVSDVKLLHSEGGKLDDKEKLTAQEVRSVEIGNPLLDQSVQRRDGQLFLPGNRTLLSLNLSGNRITEKSLHLFLTSLETQGEGGNLVCLHLQRNRFSPECDSYAKIKEMISLRIQHQTKKTEETEEDGQGG